jgi:undecaprenyl pyrophosphate phosphatase UppP
MIDRFILNLSAYNKPIYKVATPFILVPLAILAVNSTFKLLHYSNEYFSFYQAMVCIAIATVLNVFEKNKHIKKVITESVLIALIWAIITVVRNNF